MAKRKRTKGQTTIYKTLVMGIGNIFKIDDRYINIDDHQ
jgi:hypothetical protein